MNISKYRQTVLNTGLAIVAFTSSWGLSAEALRGPTALQIKPLLPVYEQLHRNPELSFHEEKTSELFASELKKLGYEVTTHFGGWGVVAVLKNGRGPTLLLRTDLDALPVTETTGLPYSSTSKFKTKEGNEVGVMHACGHDLHITNMIGVAQRLVENKKRWQGTLIIIGQPAEEKGAGASAMIKEGLFKKFPKPNYALALHVDSSKPTGTATLIAGPLTANVDSVDITLFGRGGHGARPHETIDPITMGSELVLALQPLISREKDPMAPAVLTVGSFHSGTKHNIVPNSAKLELTLRTFSKEVRARLLEGIKRKANAIAQSYQAPEPEVKNTEEPVPSVINDPKLVETLRPVFNTVLGPNHVLGGDPWTVGEDFSLYGLEGIPSVMFGLGTITETRLKKYQSKGSVPSLHSANFFPSPEEALETGITLMSESVMALLKPT